MWVRGDRAKYGHVQTGTLSLADHWSERECLPGACRRARHPNQRSGHLSQCFTPIIRSLGCLFQNYKSRTDSFMIGRSAGEGV